MDSLKQLLTPKTAAVSPVAALLLMDFQRAAAEMSKAPSAVISAAAAVLQQARIASLGVIHIRIAFRRGYPELSVANAGLARIREQGLLVEGPQTQFVDTLQPVGDEPVITKHRTGPFVGTELDQVLRVGRVDVLVLAGITTSGVVLSAVREAADRDYRIVVLRDCCFDPDSALHEVLMERVFPRQAMVVAGSEFISSMGRV